MRNSSTKCFTRDCAEGVLYVEAIACAALDEGAPPSYDADGSLRFTFTASDATYACTIRNSDIKDRYSGGVNYDAAILPAVLEEADVAVVRCPGTLPSVAVRWTLPITAKHTGYVDVNLPRDQSMPLEEKIATDELAQMNEKLQSQICGLIKIINELNERLNHQERRLVELEATSSIKPTTAPLPVLIEPSTTNPTVTLPKSIPVTKVKPVTVAAVRAALARVSRDINPRDELKASIARPGTSAWSQVRERLGKDQFLLTNKLSWPILTTPLDETTRAHLDAVVDTKTFLGYVLGENVDEMRWRFVNTIPILVDGGIEKLINCADETKLDLPERSTRDYDFYCQFGQNIHDKLAPAMKNSFRGQYAAWKRDLASKGL